MRFARSKSSQKARLWLRECVYLCITHQFKVIDNNNLVVSLNLDIGSSLTEVSVDIATLSKSILGRRRSNSLGVVGLSSSVCLELRRELRRRRNSGSGGSGGSLELAYLTLVRVGGLHIVDTINRKRDGGEELVIRCGGCYVICAREGKLTLGGAL